MSKNIEEIVDSVIPKPCLDWNKTSIAERVFCRDSLKQALTEGKLVVPMSLNKIMTMILDYSDTSSHQDAAYLGNKIHQSQFGGKK